MSNKTLQRMLNCARIAKKAPQLQLNPVAVELSNSSVTLLGKIPVGACHIYNFWQIQLNELKMLEKELKKCHNDNMTKIFLDSDIEELKYETIMLGNYLWSYLINSFPNVELKRDDTIVIENWQAVTLPQLKKW